MIIHGSNIILSSTTTGVAFAAAKSCKLSVQVDEIETSTPTDGGWKTFLAGRKSWSMSLGHLVGAIKSNVQMVGLTVNVTFGVRDSATDIVTGTAIIEEWEVSGAQGNLAQGSFVFRGTGPLT